MQGQAGKSAERKERGADRDRDCSDQPGNASYLRFQRTLLAMHSLTQCGDPAQLAVPAGGVDHRAGRPGGAGRAAEHEVGKFDEHGIGTGRRASGRSIDRCGFAGQRGRVHLDVAGDQSGVRGDPVALGDLEDVPGNEIGDGHQRQRPVPENSRLSGQVLAQCFDRAFGLPFLPEREPSVEQDHPDDRGREHPRSRGSRKGGSKPEQHGQRVGELVGQITPPAAAVQHRKCVRPVRLQSTSRFAPGQATFARSQLVQELHQRFRRVEYPAVAGLLHDRHGIGYRCSSH
jgi:hypothetical protein